MRLRFHKRALQQIDTILFTVATQSPQGASKLEARFAAASAQLQNHPFSGVCTPVAGVRRLYLTPYPYHIDDFAREDEIVVQRCRHSARRPLQG